jgi:hypothetical protein
MTSPSDSSDQPFRRVPTWKVFGIFCLAAFAILTGVVFTPWDAKPPEDADLQLKQPVLAADKNAFAYFETAGRMQVCKFPKVGGVERDWVDLTEPIGSPAEKWDPAFAGEVLAANAGIFTDLEAGLACERYASPPIEFASSISSIQILRHLTQLLSLKSKQAQLAGDTVAAVQAASQAWRLGQQVTDDANKLMEWLVGISGQAIALTRFKEIVADAKTTEPELRELQAQLAGWTSAGVVRGWKQALQGEYLWMKSMIDHLRFRPNDKQVFDDSFIFRFAWIPYTLKPNMMAEMIMPYYRHLMATADQACYANVQNYPNRIKEPDGILDQVNLFIAPNGAGKKLLGLLTPNLDRAVTKSYSLQAIVAALRLKIALRLYEQKHGQLPTELKALLPEYMKEIPLDPFDGKPFRYSKSAKAVWSIGSDLKDQGGTMEDGAEMLDHAGYDLVMPLGIRELKPNLAPSAQK